MEILFFLIPFSVLLVFAIGLIFWWSLRSGQYDDMEGPGYRVLMDDDRQNPAPEDESQKNSPTENKHESN